MSEEKNNETSDDGQPATDDASLNNDQPHNNTNTNSVSTNAIIEA